MQVLCSFFILTLTHIFSLIDNLAVIDEMQPVAQSSLLHIEVVF